MFSRIRMLLAAFDRHEFSEVGLSARLDHYVYTTSRAPQASRARTMDGPLLVQEP